MVQSVYDAVGVWYSRGMVQSVLSAQSVHGAVGAWCTEGKAVHDLELDEAAMFRFDLSSEFPTNPI